MAEIKINNQKVVFDDILKIEKANISAGEKHYSRLRINRQEAATVLVFNTDTKKVILTKQYRYAIHDKVSEPIYETLAGKVDAGESPMEAAIRETEEEIGYKVPKENMKLLASCFASPGYTSEKFYVFYATVSTKDKVNDGGGLKEENENIQVIEMEVAEFKELVLNGKIEDAKTYVAAVFFLQSN
ncbi:MAG: hydrolase [Bacteroidota bacterium]|jgi:ADP-ribose pyrophosphatase|nr:hydrolase [Bacteroidota bacterium]